MFKLSNNKSEIQKVLSQDSLENLKNSNYVNLLRANYAFKPIGLSKAGSLHNILEQVPTPQTASADFSYTPDTKYPCVQYSFAITGNGFSLSKAFDENFADQNKLQFHTYDDKKFLIYRVFDKTRIEGDDNLLAEIKQKAFLVKEVIESRIKEFNAEVDTANSELETIFNEIVEEQIRIKQIKATSIDKLNLF